MKNMNKYENCLLCPRKCGINRRTGQTGVCGVSSEIKVARAALHYWEEPCISGKRGSGAVFFSGCSLHCVFCQNREISDGKEGKVISKERLSDIFMELTDKGANNINLVTPGQYIPDIVWAVNDAKSRGMKLPIIYNTSGYENVTELKLLEGIVDVYLPDFKYMDSRLSQQYSYAADYTETAKKALEEMIRQTGKPVFFTAEDELVKEGYVEEQIMKRGVIVRHLLLPACVKDSKAVIKYLYDTYKDDIYISIMNQYTPINRIKEYDNLNRRVTKKEYDEVVDYAIELGVVNGFIQEGGTADESFIPEFDYTGLL